MNAGAGFGYTDATHAQVRGFSAAQGVIYSTDASFQSLYINKDGSITDTPPAIVWTAIPYARRMITNGVINPDLDTTYKAPWSMVGFGNGLITFMVTRGQEGVSGMTQAQAADFARVRGIENLYLMDSGHSSGIVENGTLLYSAYGEPVPQCIGLKPKGVSTMQYKVIWSKGAAERPQPNTSGTSLLTHAAGEILEATQDHIADSSDPTNPNKLWCLLNNGHYVATDYPDNNNVPQQRMQLVSAPPPPVILVSWKFTIKHDGIFYTYSGGPQ
jgi:hypothetical protein